MNKLKILITGANGMVGKNLCLHPSSESYSLITPNRKELDLLNYFEIENFLFSHKPDFVIHCAGKVGGIQANLSNQSEFLSSNIIMGINLIQSCKNNNIKKLINLASSCMYPKDMQNPLNENQLLKGMLEPTNEGYALAKLSITKLCSYVSSESNDFYYKTLVPCNIYGHFDKFDEENSHMVAAVIDKFYKAKNQKLDSVEIWGEGNARREFMYSSDLADCIWECVKNFQNMPDIMNVGMGKDYSIKEYYNLIKEIVGYNGNITNDLSKPVGMKQKLVDITQLENFGWKSKVSLYEGLSKTYDFYKKNII